MSVKPEDIAASRALRNEARSIVTAHLGVMRADLSAQTIGQQIKRKASQEAAHVLDEARAVAADNKFVIGATIAALLGWFARKPIIKLLIRVARGNKLERLRFWLVK